MNPLKKLFGQTAIYGLSSIVGRFLNYLLTPLHTAQFTTDQYGIITEMYAYVAFLVVLLTYGMETAFFRFANKDGASPNKVFSTGVSAVAFTSFAFILWAFAFQQPIANWLQYPNNSEYVAWFAIIVGLDALSALPLAKLRQNNKALKFAGVNFLNVGVNIGLNVYFIGYCLPMYQSGNVNWIIELTYNPEIGVGYVFISNLIASILKFVVLIPITLKNYEGFNKIILKETLWFGLPLLVAGLAGIINETLDRILLKRLLFDTLGERETLSQLGVYGANYKVSIIITLFIQAFRYAAEPFFFAQEKDTNAKAVYAKVMNLFVGVVAVIFLGVMLYLDILKFFIPNQAYWEGLKVVPILLFANIFLGVYYNQSIWYKLTDKTYFGAYMAIFGALTTLVLNFILIPKMGYLGSAWTTLICYFSMVLVSYFLGQKHYPVNYNLLKVFGYLSGSFLLWWIWNILNLEQGLLYEMGRAFIFISFLGTFFLIEKPLKNG